MCQPKYWNKIYTEEVKESRHKSILSIIAERSDFEVINIQLELEGNDCLGTIASKCKKAIDSLESYRDCDCSVKTGTCIKHLDAVEIFASSSPKSVVTFGRR